MTVKYGKMIRIGNVYVSINRNMNGSQPKIAICAPVDVPIERIDQ